MRYWIIPILLVLLSTFAQANSIFDKWVYPGDVITFDGRTASIQLGAESTIRVRMDTGEFVVLSTGGTRQIEEYVFHYLQIDREVCDHSSCNPKRYGKIDPVTFETIPGIKLEIEKKEAELKVTRVAEQNEVLLNEQTRITVTIENTGNTAATNIKFEENFPIGIQITDTTMGTKTTDSLKVNLGTIQAGEKREFSYVVRLIQRLDASLIATVSYNVEGKPLQQFSNVLPFSIRDVFEITSALSPKSSNDVNNITSVNITVFNTNPDNTESAKVNAFSITVPQNVTVVEKPADATQNNNVITIPEFNLAGQKNKTISLKLTSKYAANYDLTASLNGYFRTILPTQTESVRVSFGSPKSEHDVTLTLVPQTRDYLEGDTAKIWLVVYNGDTVPLTNIKGTILVNNTVHNISVSQLASKESYTHPVIDLILPLVNKSTSFDVKANISMISTKVPTGISKQETAKISVKDSADALSITAKLDQGSSLKQNQSGVFTIEIENKLEAGSISLLKVTPVVPEQFTPDALTAKTINLDLKEKILTHAIKITAPFYVNPNQTILTAKLQLGEAIFEKNFSLKVDLIKPQLTIDRKLPNTARLGDILTEEFTIKNSGEEIVRDIRIRQKGDIGYDILEKENTQIISELKKGEQLTIPIVSRVTKTGEIIIPQIQATGIDRFGNIHTYNISSRKITVSESQINEPAIYMEKNVLDIKNKVITVEAILYNTGGKEIKGTFSDERFIQDLTIRPGQSERVQYGVDVPAIENVTLQPATFAYAAQKENWKSYSGTLPITRTLTVEETQNSEFNAQELNATQKSLRGVTGRDTGISPPDWFNGSNIFTLIGITGFALIGGLVAFSIAKKKLLEQKRKKKVYDEFS